MDNIFSASYGTVLCITHKCIIGDENKQLKIDIANNLFRDKVPSYFHHARHKEMYDEVKGGIMYCPDYNETVPTAEIVNKALQGWKDCLFPGDRVHHNRPDTVWCKPVCIKK
jgi:hypothetical protein